MRVSITRIFIIALIFAVSSCYYDKEYLLYGGANNAPCTDTTTVTYTQKVVPLLQQFCYSCHIGSFPSGNQLMGTYAADKAMAQNGKLYGTMNHVSGFSPMPKGMAKMTNCQIATIKKWIDAGMQNN